jgi:pyruvate/2-oxoglutarate dehydrogenase complex dihydrolipoamide acyltransferase (E2) component
VNKEFKLPDVGEGLTEADIVSWHVKPGDTVEVNQIIVEIETAKAVVELPSPYAGVVSGLLVKEGQTVDVGTPIISVDVAGTGPQPREQQPREQQPAQAAPPVAVQGDSAVTDTPEEPGSHAVLVGYGVKPGSTRRRLRKAAPTRPASYPATPSAPGASHPAPPPAETSDPAPPPAETSAGKSVRALAKPPVRKLARDLGVDLASLTGTGPQGSVTREDVQRAAGEPHARSGDMQRGNGAGGATAASPSGTEERIPVRGVRKHTAAAMVGSAFTAPHVTEFLQIDATETMAAVRRARELPEFAGLRVSPLLFVAKALLVAVARHPMINSSWDEAAQEIVVKRYVNLGIAVATERGLLVPSVKRADSLSLAGLATALDELAATARSGKATPADLSGGTITITNVGVFGVDAGTPILTPGEAAILAFGQVREAPWVHQGQLAVRSVTTLSLSFDHRIVDGELGSAVLRDVGSMLEDPVRMLAWS